MTADDEHLLDLLNTVGLRLVSVEAALGTMEAGKSPNQGVCACGFEGPGLCEHHRATQNHVAIVRRHINQAREQIQKTYARGEEGEW